MKGKNKGETPRKKVQKEKTETKRSKQLICIKSQQKENRK